MLQSHYQRASGLTTTLLLLPFFNQLHGKLRDFDVTGAAHTASDKAHPLRRVSDGGIQARLSLSLSSRLSHHRPSDHFSG
jgi:hypothetical protein